jgi:hypothetical protein
MQVEPPMNKRLPECEGNIPMHNVHKITGVTISTKSDEPLSGVVEINTVGSTIKLELNADMAHDLCTHLDRFLTQQRRVR